MIPNEVVTIIFNLLEPKHLAQCQLTNKLWRKLSLRPLYSRVIVTSDIKYKQYILTVTIHPYLTDYLKSVDVGSYFGPKFLPILIRTYELLFDFKYLTDLSALSPLLEFWNKLKEAGDRGGLRLIKRLPIPCSKAFKLYISTVLLFKRTLTSLVFQGPNNSPELNSLIADVTLFENLTEIYIKNNKNCGLSYYDNVFTQCSLQKHMKAHLDRSSRKVKTEIHKPSLIIEPNKVVETLECHWELISYDDQLNYLMKKFPDLKKLTISLQTNEALGLIPSYYQDSLTPHSRPTAATFVSFLKYVFSIQKFLVTLILKTESIRFVWKTLKEIKDVNDNVRLVFNLEKTNGFTRNMATRFKKDQTVLYFRYYSSRNDLPDRRFLDAAGPYIASLQIRNEDFLQKCSELKKEYRDPEYIFDILKLCPYILELDMDTIFLRSNTPKCYGNRFPLRSLSICIDYSDLSMPYLEKLAPTIPDLKQLNITIQYKQNLEYRRYISIYMPNTDFDLITWTYKDKSHVRGQDIRCYLHVKTLSKDRFFMANLDGLLPISGHVYFNALSQLRIRIVCQALRDFKLQISTTTL